jgi:16S rRNA A1518/A1519 N6-dimethyltransferase RsmA/KsgA/DIM1 with predicted DNA glycosylase/AP lyase activity
MKEDIKAHWETIYNSKQPNEVSWTQEVPAISLELIRNSKVPKNAKIIDIGGGDSKLVDFLLQERYNNISVLDISEAAINRSKKRLGKEANKVKWIVSDILNFNPKEKYELWHDRAVFHFQTDPSKIKKYINIIQNVVDKR